MDAWKALPIGVGEAGAGKGVLQKGLFLSRWAAPFCQEPGVDFYNRADISGPPHPAFDFQAGNPHSFQFGKAPRKAVIF